MHKFERDYLGQSPVQYLENVTYHGEIWLVDFGHWPSGAGVKDGELFCRVRQKYTKINTQMFKTHVHRNTQKFKTHVRRYRTWQPLKFLFNDAFVAVVGVACKVPSRFI